MSFANTRRRRVYRHSGVLVWFTGVVLFLFISQPLAALNVTVTSINQTQAVLQEQGFSGSCTIQISASPSFNPLHPDVNGGLYNGASTDSSRPDTITSADGGTRMVTIGHQTDDRALAAYTTYYYQVSGCGGTVNGSFKTANLSTGTTRTEQAPFNASKWGNLGFPAFDWTQKRSYVDPMTGVSIVPMAVTSQTWRTGGGGYGAQAGFSRAFTDWAGGAGWTNPSGILLGASSNASTGSTSPIDLYANLDNTTAAGSDPIPYDYHRTLEDIGVVIWGGGTSASDADRIVDLCIVLNGDSGCSSNVIQVTLPIGSITHVGSGSSDPDGAFPAAFPASPFYGWTGGGSPVIRMENRETFGTVTVSGHSLSISSVDKDTHFSSALTPGNRIFISGSSCANNVCTISAAPTSPNTVTVRETPGDGIAVFRAYGWGIRIWKESSNGTVTVGAKFKLAGSGVPIGMQSGGDYCSSVPVTSADGKRGYLCSITSAVNGYGWLAFIATDGTTRLLSHRTNFSFDETQGNVFYATEVNSSGGWTIVKYTYIGDYTTELDYKYGCSSDGGCPPISEPITSVDLMPHSSNADLDQQIQSSQGLTLPAYNTALYGSWNHTNTAVGYYGSSGHFAFFCNVYSGQGQPSGGGPGWCASVDLSQNPAKVVRLIHTLDGTGMPSARFGSLHSAQALAGSPNTLFLSLDDLLTNKTSTLHGGPYQAPVLSVLMADGSWGTDTCLDWPPGQGSCSHPNYERSCPSRVGPRRGPSPGAQATECVTLRLPAGGVCNAAATTIEKTTWPCPWNSNYSQYPTMQADDNSVDLAAIGGFDSEHFHILSVRPDSDNTLRVVAMRNGTYDYCSISPWNGLANATSAQFPGQLKHASGWTLTMMPGSMNSCGWSAMLQEQISGSTQELGRSFSGHFQTGLGPSGGVNFVTSAATIYNQSFFTLGQIPPVYNTTGDPAFHGTPAQIGIRLQSYTDDSQLAAGDAGYAWALDMNPYVACAAESLGCGTLRSTNAVAPNVYRVESIGSASASSLTYKTQPMIGWAGRYQLRDISGPSSNVDATPYSMCFALRAGECRPGSSANDVYVNVPSAYDPGYCTGSISWASIPCVLFGDNAPAGGIRQFRIYTNDTGGAYSRFISNGWGSLGRHYPYSHATAYQTGQWAMLMGANLIGGYNIAGLMIGLPPWAERADPDNDFKGYVVQIPSGLQYARVQFGYSRYIGPNSSPANGLFCTSRSESCVTKPGALFNFESEGTDPISCSGGCSVTIPTVAPNLLYYRVRRSSDGVNWSDSDMQAVALQ